MDDDRHATHGRLGDPRESGESRRSDGRSSGDHRHGGLYHGPGSGHYHHHGHHGSLGSAIHFPGGSELAPLLQLPPPSLYTCTVGRNRSGARCTSCSTALNPANQDECLMCRCGII